MLLCTPNRNEKCLQKNSPRQLSNLKLFGVAPLLRKYLQQSCRTTKPAKLRQTAESQKEQTAILGFYVVRFSRVTVVSMLAGPTVRSKCVCVRVEAKEQRDLNAWLFALCVPFQ
jgi:hypothetical protein